MNENTNFDYEPMDIDSSANSYSPMEISYNETVKNDSLTEKLVDNTSIEEITRFHLKIRPDTEKRSTNTFSSWFLIALFFVGIVISIISFNAVNLKCFNEFDPKILEDSLSMQVFGQSKAVETFISALQVNASSKILFLYGGTGVGKTLTISVALEHLKNYSNVYHYTMPSFIDKFGTDLKIGYIFCEKSIIVVDDLGKGQKHIQPIIKKIIESSESLKKNLTVILVYNCDTVQNKFLKVCDKSFFTELQRTFYDINALKFFIRFKPLTVEILKKCIENELKLRHIIDVDVNIVMKKFNVSLDGCKGVYSKIKTLHIL